MRGDFAELFESDLAIFDDFLRQNIRIRKIVRFLERFVPEPEDVEAGLVAVSFRSNTKKVPSVSPI